MPEIRRDLLLKSMMIPRRLNDPPGVLYHYSSPAAFASIVKKREIWLTNAA
jgi:hypothetical protein